MFCCYLSRQLTTETVEGAKIRTMDIKLLLVVGPIYYQCSTLSLSNDKEITFGAVCSTCVLLNTILDSQYVTETMIHEHVSQCIRTKFQYCSMEPSKDT